MLFTLLFALATAQAAPVKIHPQFVVNRMLQESRDAKTIELDRLAADSVYYNSRAPYDWIINGSGSYEDSQALFLSGGGNLRDKTSIWSLGLQKRIPTGTTFGVSFARTMQDSVFRPTGTGSRSPYIVYDVGEISVTQDLVGNFFGIVERRSNRAAIRSVEAAELNKKEAQENLVLQAIQLFWDTYVAKENLREAINQREKYEALVKEIERKNTMGFVNPGDLPKARAEFGAQVRNVKNASFAFLSTVDRLFVSMRLDLPTEAVEFEVSQDLPPLPDMGPMNLDRLRMVEAAQVAYESSEDTKRAADLSGLPDLKLVGKANFYGLEATQSRSFSNMLNGRDGKYSVALTLTYRLFSDQTRVNQNDALVKYEKALNTLLKTREEQNRELKTAAEQVRLTYASASSAIEEAKNWETTVREQERSYRQGRLDFSQLIQDYNAYYRSRATRIRAIGDYHIALNRFAAASDRLVQ